MLTAGGTGSRPCSSGAHGDTLWHPLPPRPAFGGAGETTPFRAAPTVAPRFWRATPNQSRGCQGRFLQRELAGAPGGSSRLRPSVKLVVPAQPTPALGSLLSVHTWPPPLLEGARPLHPPPFLLWERRACAKVRGCPVGGVQVCQELAEGRGRRCWSWRGPCPRREDLEREGENKI